MTALTPADRGESLAIRAAQLAALLRLLVQAQQDLHDFDSQGTVGWLLPLAERMADALAESVDELETAMQRGAEDAS